MAEQQSTLQPVAAGWFLIHNQRGELVGYPVLRVDCPDPACRGHVLPTGIEAQKVTVYK